MLVADRRLPSAFDQPLEHPVDVGPAHAAGELAIAERTGAPFAEQVIVLRVKGPSPVELADGRHAVFDRLSPFEHERPVSANGEVKGGQEPRRTGTDYDRPFRKRL